MKEAIIEIDALQLDDETLRLLSNARWHGFLTKNRALNTLADGGAQLIRSFGRKKVAELYPKGLIFEITEADKAEMDSILASDDLKRKPTTEDE